MSLLARLEARDNVSAMGFVLASTVAFVAMYGLIKDLAESVHPLQIAFLRNLFGLLVLTPLFLRYGLAPLKTAKPGLMTLRAVINMGAMLFYFIALSLAPLADVAALAFSAPIFATILAIFVLGEVVGVRRWIAILAGLAGAFVILRPGFATLEIGHLFTLASAACWGVALLIIKVLARTESSLTITLYMGLLMTPMSLVPALFVWGPASLEQYGVMAVIGALGTAGQWLLAEGLKRGDTNVVMPLDFFKLVWAALLGFLAFGEIPDPFTWLGGVMIFASATYIALRERKLKRDKAPPPSPLRP